MTLNDFLKEWNNDSDKVLVHTSGSTGKPKPMWVEKAKMLNSARITCDFLGLRPGDTALLCMPLDYIAGKMVVVRAIERNLWLINETPSGHPLSDPSVVAVPCAGNNPNGIADSGGPQAESLRPLHWSECTFAAMVPLQVYNSLQVAEEKERLMQIKHLIIGGGAIDDKLTKELRAFPNYVWSTYGMTETLSHIALRRLNGEEASEWYTPFDSVKVSQTAEGCLVIDAPLVHDGKLITNDIVEMRPIPGVGKGPQSSSNQQRLQFRIRGRKDNVIDSGGIKIQIEEVEQALKPFLKAPFAITKAPDEKFGEIVVLVTEETDLSEVQEICMNALPKYWQPRRYKHINKLPMTETSKPARKLIEQLAHDIS